MGLDESLLRSTVGGGSSESCHKQGQTTLAAHNLAAQTARGHFKLWLCVSFLHLKVSIKLTSVTVLSSTRNQWRNGYNGWRKKKSNPKTKRLRKILEHLQCYSVTKYRVYVIDLTINTRPLWLSYVEHLPEGKLDTML